MSTKVATTDPHKCQIQLARRNPLKNSEMSDVSTTDVASFQRSEGQSSATADTLAWGDPMRIRYHLEQEVTDAFC